MARRMASLVGKFGSPMAGVEIFFRGRTDPPKLPRR